MFDVTEWNFCKTFSTYLLGLNQVILFATSPIQIKFHWVLRYFFVLIHFENVRYLRHIIAKKEKPPPTANQYWRKSIFWGDKEATVQCELLFSLKRATYFEAVNNLSIVYIDKELDKFPSNARNQVVTVKANENPI